AKLETVLKVSAEIAGVGEPEKRSYRGCDYYILADSPVPVTCTLHKDRLVLSLFPQPVPGYIRGSEGKYRTWQIPAEVKSARAAAVKTKSHSRLLAVTV